MKKLFIILSILVGMLSYSCEKSSKNEDPDELNGDISPMAGPGVTVTSSNIEIAGMSNFSAVVTSLNNGISSYSASATVSNVLLKNMISGFPGVTINGDQVSITDMKMQQTIEGIKCITGPGAGVLVKYDSKVGDTYPIGNSGFTREVVSKTGVDDYYYGGLLIKTIQVEDMDPVALKNTGGVNKVTYIANHKFGLLASGSIWMMQPVLYFRFTQASRINPELLHARGIQGLQNLS